MVIVWYNISIVNHYKSILCQKVILNLKKDIKVIKKKGTKHKSTIQKEKNEKYVLETVKAEVEQEILGKMKELIEAKFELAKGAYTIKEVN